MPRLLQPEMDVSNLVINNLPPQQMPRERLSPDLLLNANGDPPPDRGITDRFPPPVEVGDEPGQ
jgi:hypothetical protein